MDKVSLQKFADSLWPGPPVVELRFDEEPIPGAVGWVAGIEGDKAIIELYPIQTSIQSHWATVLHELAHVSVFSKFPDSENELHGEVFRREYRALLHRAVEIYRQEPLWEVLVEAVEELSIYRDKFPAKPQPCRYWFHPPMRPRPWYKRLYSYLIR